jgi:hypothetical protein
MLKGNGRTDRCHLRSLCLLVPHTLSASLSDTALICGLRKCQLTSALSVCFTSAAFLLRKARFSRHRCGKEMKSIMESGKARRAAGTAPELTNVRRGKMTQPAAAENTLCVSIRSQYVSLATVFFPLLLVMTQVRHSMAHCDDTRGRGYTLDKLDKSCTMRGERMIFMVKFVLQARRM